MLETNNTLNIKKLTSAFVMKKSFTRGSICHKFLTQPSSTINDPFDLKSQVVIVH